MLTLERTAATPLRNGTQPSARIEQSSIPAFACAVDKSTHDFSHEIGINDDERSRGSTWLLLFVAGHNKAYRAAIAKGRILYTRNVRRHNY